MTIKETYLHETNISKTFTECRYKINFMLSAELQVKVIAKYVYTSFICFCVRSPSCLNTYYIGNLLNWKTWLAAARVRDSLSLFWSIIDRYHLSKGYDVGFPVIWNLHSSWSFALPSCSTYHGNSTAFWSSLSLISVPISISK